MTSDSDTQQPPVVFISYAHESDALRTSVKALADWLVQRGCRVLTDHAYIYRPPAQGWQTWMLGCIEQSGTVLVVCTPQLRARYEKTAAPDSGRGATYEGAIVTQQIYDAAMRNTKFQPILPDDGDEGNIPTFLKPWWNGHRFPGGNDGILRMILDGSGDKPEKNDPPIDDVKSFTCEHERLAAEKLAAADARQFLVAMQQEFRKRFQSEPPCDAAAMVRWFAGRESTDVQQLFYLVRRALGPFPHGRHEDFQRKLAEEAAVALYCLAAMRLVDTAVARANEVRPGDYLLLVPRSERVICAIIATALFGGELHLKPVEAGGELQPEYVFEVHVPVSGDRQTEAFERAAFTAVFENQADAPQKFVEAAPLTPRERARLAARIDDIHDRQRRIALIVHGLQRVEAAAGLARNHKLPVLFPAAEVPTSEFTTKLLGMDADRLMAEIGELSICLTARTDFASQPPSVPSSSS